LRPSVLERAAGHLACDKVVKTGRAVGREGCPHGRTDTLVETNPMSARKAKPERDVTKGYPLTQFADKLRRLADAVEGGERFRIQVAGERVSIPPDAMISVEHERGEDGEEVEFQITWMSPVLPQSGGKSVAKGKARAASGAKPRSKEG
jgi:amphi-Trp domain-containing protein